VRLVAALALTALVACGGGAGEAERAARADLDRLEALLARDPAAEPLREVDEAIDDELLVRAGELLEAQGLPAAREAARAAGALEVRSPEARRLGEALSAAYRARVEALEQTARVLARGPGEGLALVDAFRAQREAEGQILAVREALEALRSGRATE
jgi:hypothetical protein